jgi:osmotically-inducible protein OsmY
MTYTSETARNRLRIVIYAGAAALALLALVSILVGLGDIEADLENRARAALDDQGITVADVEFDGRDAVLRGVVASEADRRTAVEIVRGIDGVRTVRDELTVGSPGASQTASEAEGTSSP